MRTPQKVPVQHIGTNESKAVSLTRVWVLKTLERLKDSSNPIWSISFFDICFRIEVKAVFASLCFVRTRSMIYRFNSKAYNVEALMIIIVKIVERQCLRPMQETCINGNSVSSSIPSLCHGKTER